MLAQPRPACIQLLAIHHGFDQTLGFTDLLERFTDTLSESSSTPCPCNFLCSPLLEDHESLQQGDTTDFTSICRRQDHLHGSLKELYFVPHPIFDAATEAAIERLTEASCMAMQGGPAVGPRHRGAMLHGQHGAEPLSGLSVACRF